MLEKSICFWFNMPSLRWWLLLLVITWLFWCDLRKFIFLILKFFLKLFESFLFYTQPPRRKLWDATLLYIFYYIFWNKFSVQVPKACFVIQLIFNQKIKSLDFLNFPKLIIDFFNKHTIKICLLLFFRILKSFIK